VNGAKIAKSRGQIHISNASRNKAGLISHHINMTRRGPKSRKIVVAQHTYFTPFDEKFLKDQTAITKNKEMLFIDLDIIIIISGCLNIFLYIK